MLTTLCHSLQAQPTDIYSEDPIIFPANLNSLIVFQDSILSYWLYLFVFQDSFCCTTAGSCQRSVVVRHSPRRATQPAGLRHGAVATRRRCQKKPDLDLDTGKKEREEMEVLAGAVPVAVGLLLSH